MDAVLSPARQRASERLFFIAMALALAAVVFIGFAPSFFLRPWFPAAAALAPPEPIFYVHGTVFAAWMGLLVAQTALIGTGRFGLHRRLGTAGIGLAALMVVMGVFASLVAARRPEGFVGVPVPPLQFVVVPLTDLVLFGTFVTLAGLWRRDAQAHKRLMLLATVNVIGAAAARIPLGIDPILAAFVVPDLLILTLAAWDIRSRRRLHRVTLWAGAATILSQPLRLAVADTPGWLAFAEWATRLLN